MPSIDDTIGSSTVIAGSEISSDPAWYAICWSVRPTPPQATSA
jgi:hypothetical protein